jgi:TM2 domain-containing membrane protein YozV
MNTVQTTQTVLVAPAERYVKKKTALLLAFFLGGLGIHKFYTRKTWLGVLYLVFCWTYIPGCVAFIEFIIWLCTDQAEWDTKYNTIQVVVNQPQ